MISCRAPAHPTGVILGTVRLDGLPYRNLTLTNFYPYGEPAYPAPRT